MAGCVNDGVSYIIFTDSLDVTVRAFLSIWVDKYLINFSLNVFEFASKLMYLLPRTTGKSFLISGSTVYMVPCVASDPVL